MTAIALEEASQKALDTLVELLTFKMANLSAESVNIRLEAARFILDLWRSEAEADRRQS